MSAIVSAGLVIKVEGDLSKIDWRVSDQDPAANEEAELGTRVTITLSESAAQKSARESAEAAQATAAASAASDAKAKADAAEAAAAAEAKAKADAEAAAAAADADRSTFAEVDARTWALIAKNPDAHVGEKVVLYGVITQFDSATGASIFRASTGANEQEYSYQYETNTLVTAADESQVADLVQDDLVRMFVKVSGSFSYDTQVGGNTTVPRVAILSYDLLGHDD